LENLYVKTSDYDLDDIISFCVGQYEEYDLDYDEIQEWKNIIRENYPHTNIIWTVYDIDLLDIWESEYYDLKKYNHIVDYGYEVVEAGYNKERGWVYLQAESLSTHYRSYLFNLQNITNLVVYIRQRKIDQILD
jgi:hypothetical protein